MAPVAIVVTGLPASGKSTIARRLAADLDWPMFDKDDFLEALFDRHPVNSLDDRRRLSRQSDDVFRQAACGAKSAVLVSHWQPANGVENTGTPTDFLKQAFGRIVEVHCACTVETALQRFTARERHPSHMDAERGEDAIRHQFEALAPGYPLGLGALISVDTDVMLDMAPLISRVREDVSS